VVMRAEVIDHQVQARGLGIAVTDLTHKFGKDFRRPSGR
jgi:hypothetical protein